MLTPNAKYTVNGVTVKEKIIPDGTRWTNAERAVASGFKVGDLYKKQAKLSSGTGKVLGVTIHNTADIANVYDDAEQYTRATYNENMKSSRVHFYVDDNGAWQNLKAGTGMTARDPIGSAEVSWHAGDGSVKDGGNMTTLSIEIIMGEGTTADEKAYDNGARLAAWLLYKHGLNVDKLYTHTYWVNKTYGKKFAYVDDQCTNLIAGKKWCPTYIFNSYTHSVAKANWVKFKDKVNGYLTALKGVSVDNTTTVSNNVESTQVETFALGDTVKVNDGVEYYSDGKRKIASFVFKSVLYVRGIEQSGEVILVSTLKTANVYTGRIKATDLHKI